MSEQLQTVTGIVIRETKTKESDKIITVFSRENGIMNIYVPGAMRLKNKFHSATGLFTYSEFVVFKSNKTDLYRLNEGNVKHIFHDLSLNVEYLALAMYMSELLTEVNVNSDSNNEILRLFLNVLYMMTSKKWTVLLCKSVFEMRLLCETGFRPNLVGCSRCGRYEAELFDFDIENGEIHCCDCFRDYDSKNPVVEMPTLMALRYISYADLDQMFTFKIGKGYVDQLSCICEAYTLYHTKSNYKTLDFFKSVYIGA